MADFAGLETILDETLAALKAGDLPGLSDLSERAEAALAAQSPCDAVLAGRLLSKAQRNERMITAAMKGVKAARQRVQDLTTTGRFSTYDAGGHRDQVGVAPSLPSRRV